MTSPVKSTKPGKDRCGSVVVFVPGILTWPGAARNWSGRAVTWTHINTPHKAEKVEYLSGPGASRILGQRNRVRKLARTLEFYRGFEITLVGHSNGCSVILEALRTAALVGIRAHRLVFVAPTCDEDCERNGINGLMRRGKVGRLEVLMGGRDWQARLAGSWLGRLFGYGRMGVTGPVGCVPGRSDVIRCADWGHSDWWGPGGHLRDQQFEWTMRKILRRLGP